MNDSPNRIPDISCIYQDVTLGPDATVGQYVILGEAPAGMERMPTVIGAKAVIRSHTLIYHGNRIGDGFQTGHHVMVRELNHMGDNVSLGTGSVVEHHVVIGNRVRMHSQVFVPEYCVLEDECWLGPRVVLTNARYPGSPEAKKHLKGVVVGRSARIGANATVLPGVIIGENALVGAGAVVVRDVPAGVVVAGNPARIVNSIDKLPY